MATLLGIPIITIAIILQAAVVSQIKLLSGAADLVLLAVISWMMNERVEDIWGWAIVAGLVVGFVSELPFWVPLSGYIIIGAICIYLKKRVWQIPTLALFSAIFIGTIVFHSITIGVLRFLGTFITLQEAFNLITLPSILLNLLFAIPIQGLIGEIVQLIEPREAEV